jgi:hypothetical protein
MEHLRFAIFDGTVVNAEYLVDDAPAHEGFKKYEEGKSEGPPASTPVGVGEEEEGDGKAEEAAWGGEIFLHDCSKKVLLKVIDP